jgi:hypothetical protein
VLIKCYEDAPSSYPEYTRCTAARAVQGRQQVLTCGTWWSHLALRACGDWSSGQLGRQAGRQEDRNARDQAARQIQRAEEQAGRQAARQRM